MKRTVRATCVLATALLGPVAGSPAHAEVPADGRVYVGRFYAPAPPVDTAALVGALTGVLDAASCSNNGTGATVAKTYASTELYADVWQTPVLSGYRTWYVWHGEGHTFASKHCADGVSVTAQIIDFAPVATDRRQITVTGPRATSTAACDGKVWDPYRVTCVYPDDDVLYSDPFSGYVRGESTVTVQAHGSYVDHVTGKTVPLPCDQETWAVTPTPEGPRISPPIEGACA
jgi:hypothetical protein